MHRIQVGNRQYISMIFIPVIVEIAGHRFEIYMLVSEIQDNVNLVLGLKMYSNKEAYSTHKNVVLTSWIVCYQYFKKKR